MPEALRAADLLAERWDVAADVWSVTSWGELNRDGIAAEKAILRHPRPPGPGAVRHRGARQDGGPGGRCRDWMRAVPEQIRPWVPNTYVTLGTDGSASPTPARGAALLQHRRRVGGGGGAEALARDGEIDPSVAISAAQEYRIDDVMAAPEQTSDPESPRHQATTRGGARPASVHLHTPRPACRG